MDNLANAVDRLLILHVQSPSDIQNLEGDHSVAGVPASLYNLTKSVPDPLFFIMYFASTLQGSCTA